MVNLDDLFVIDGDADTPEYNFASSGGGTGVGDINNSTWELENLTKAGTFIIELTTNANGTCDGSTPVEVTLTVTKGDGPTATPTVGKTNPTSVANNDGTITGVDITMEYKLSSDPGYTQIAGTSVTSLTPGTYNVRVAETDLLNAGTGVASVTIPYFVAITGSNQTIEYPGTDIDLTTVAGLFTVSHGSGTRTYTVDGHANNGAGDMVSSGSMMLKPTYVGDFTIGLATAAVPNTHLAGAKATAVLTITRKAGVGVKDNGEHASIDGVDETSAGGDGKITGVTSALEYKLSTANGGSTTAGYTGIISSADITGLAPGTYYVRRKENGLYSAGPKMDIVIAAFTKSAATITPGSASVTYGTSDFSGETVNLAGLTGLFTTITPNNQSLRTYSVTSGGTGAGTVGSTTAGSATNRTLTVTRAGPIRIALATDTDNDYLAGTTSAPGYAVLTVVPGTQAAPSAGLFTGNPPTTIGGTDGSITGITGDMEWSSNASSGFGPAPAANLSPGPYYVRYKATDLRAAGSNTTVTIEPNTGIAVSHTAQNNDITYTGVTVDVAAPGFLFTLDPNAGTPTYSVTNGTGTNSNFNTATGALTVSKAGTFDVSVSTAATTTHKIGTAGPVTLTVNKGTGPGAPNISGTTPISGVGLFDGSITVSGNFAEMEYNKNGGAYGDEGDLTSTTISGLGAGIYNVRFKETVLYEAGQIATRTIGTVVLDPVTNTAKPGPHTVTYSVGGTYNLAQMFNIDPDAGNPNYTKETGGTGDGSILGATLTITKAGTINIGLATDATGTHDAGGMVTATLTVDKAAAPTINWPTAATITYGAALSTSALTPASNAYGAFAWGTPATVPAVLTAANTGYDVKFIPSQSTLDNYEPITPLTKPVMFTVNKADQPLLTVDAVTGKTYGDAAFQLGTSGGGGTGAVTYTVKSGPGTVVATTGMLTITGAGSIVVTAIKALDANYNAGVVSVDRTITIAPAQLTVRAEDKSVTVGANPPEYTLTYEGFKYSDTKSTVTITGTPDATCTYTNTSPVDSYPITVNLNGATTNNYNLHPVNGTLTVNPVGGFVIGFTTNNVARNGITATGSISPASPQAAGTSITVTIALAGTALAEGIHTVGLTSEALGAGGITPPGTITKVVAAGAVLSGTAAADKFLFTFDMPSKAVNDLVVTHSFLPATSTYTVAAPANKSENGVTASASVSPAGPYAAGSFVDVTVALTGTPSASGTHTVSLASAAHVGGAITVTPTVASLSVTAGVAITAPNTFVFRFTMPANAVSDLVITHTYAPPAYTVNAPISVPANGVVASAVAAPSGSQPAGKAMTVTVTLAGTPLVSGVHTVGVASASDAGAITAPAVVTKSVTAGTALAGTDTYAFTFTMPAKNVTDLVVVHTFAPATYAIDFASGGNGKVENGVTATGVISPSGNQAAGKVIDVTVSLTGTATAAGTHIVRLASTAAGSITPPASITKVVTAGANAAAGGDNTFKFSFIMPAGAVTDLAVSHTFSTTPPETYAIAFEAGKNIVAANGITATGVITPTGPQVAGVGATVTVTLTGTATAAGTHTVGLTSATLGAGKITAPATVTKVVTAAQSQTADNTFAFTFTVPASAVSDLVVTHVFTAGATYPIAFEAGKNIVTVNGVTATGVVSPTGNQAASGTITVTVALTGVAAAAGKHTVGLTSVTLGASGITAPADVVKTVAAGAEAGPAAFAFTFKMPPNAVNDLVVVHGYTPPPPVITISAQPRDVEVIAGAVSGNLTVAAVAVPSAALTYQWYSNTTATASGGTAVDGATSASFQIPSGLATGSYYYYVVVKATGAESVTSEVAAVTVAPATFKVLFGAPNANGTVSASVVTAGGKTPVVSGGDVANGSKIEFTAVPAANHVVRWWEAIGAELAGDTPRALTQTVASLKSALTVTVEFIHKDDLIEFDKSFEVIVTGVYTYSGEKILADVVVEDSKGAELKAGRDYTVKYEDNVNAGKARVVITGAGRYDGTLSAEFTIAKKTPEWSDLVISADGLVTLKGDNDGWGNITLKVDGVAADRLPSKAGGPYKVEVAVTAGKNYRAGEFKKDDYVDVVEVVREVVVSGAAVVVPPVVFAGEFAVGPNVASRSAGRVGFFWQGRALSKGSLAVFSASGDLVKRVAVSDKVAGNSGRREVGAWDLKDAKGRLVGEGSYVVRGVLKSKDGSVVKVSRVVNVK